MSRETDRREYGRVHAVFAQVVHLQPGARGAALRVLCDGDEPLRAEVEALLAEDDACPDLLDSAALERALEGSAADGDDPAESLVGQRIAGFLLERVIESGGMGTVYLALQDKPARTVALKVMRQGLVSRSARRRFEYETQILARLQHQGIAQVYQVGTFVPPGGGAERPFFAMEFVHEARSITEFAEQEELGLRPRLELFVSVCEAVQHGHQRGVIHRDLKPANVLVDDTGQAKVIDFGVAKATDADVAQTTLHTEVGQLIGTLQYMSPEQCDATPMELDTRSDVYSLGLVLYELLCGVLPYDVSRAPVHEAVRMIKEADPARPSAIDRVLRGDLETIVLQAIEKDRERRYASALELAQDIRRFLDDQPIHARPPSALYQMRKFAKRNRALSGGVAATFVALVAGVIATTGQAARASTAEREALDLWSTEQSLREAAEAARIEANQHEREARRQAAIAEQVNAFLETDLLGSVDPAVALGREVTVRQVFDLASERIEGKFADEPLIEASIRATLGRMYIRLSDFESARTHLERARELLSEERGEEDPRTLAAMNDLGQALGGLARYEEAEELHETVLERRRLALGDDHQDTLMALFDLGAVYRGQTRYDEALAIFERVRDAAPPGEKLHLESRAAIALLRWELGDLEGSVALNQEVYDEQLELYGEDHPDTLATLVKLGAAHMMLRDFELAESHLERALELAPGVLGEDHQATLSAQNNLLWTWLEQGRSEDVVEPYRDLIARTSARYGDDHPDTAIMRGNLGLALVRLGRFGEALEQLEISLASSRKVTPGHWLEAAHLARYGQALAGLGRGEEAGRALYEACEIAAAKLGETDGRTLATRWDLIEFLLAEERLEEVAVELDEVVPLLVEVYGEGSRRGMHLMNERGLVLWKLGRYEEALEAHEYAHRVRSEQLGPDHIDTRKSLYNIAIQLIDLDRNEEAITALEQLKQDNLRISGERSGLTIYARATLAMLFNRVDRHEDALVELEVVVPIVAGGPGALSAAFHAVCLLHRGEALTGLGRLEEAEEALLQAHSMLEAQGSEKVPDAVHALVELYDRWSRDSEREKWSARLEELRR